MAGVVQSTRASTIWNFIFPYEIFITRWTFTSGKCQTAITKIKIGKINVKQTYSTIKKLRLCPNEKSAQKIPLKGLLAVTRVYEHLINNNTRCQTDLKVLVKQKKLWRCCIYVSWINASNCHVIRNVITCIYRQQYERPTNGAVGRSAWQAHCNGHIDIFTYIIQVKNFGWS